MLARAKWSEAEPLVRRALLVRPESLEAKTVLADLEVGEGEWQGARRELEAAEKIAPQSPGVHQRLAQVYEKLKLSADAEREKKLAAKFETKQESAGSGPRAGDPAPEFSVTKMGLEDRATLAELQKDGPVLLIFGSYTCPNFRGAAETLNRLYPEYRKRIPFYLIYIREAHSTGDWASTRNEREGIVMAPAANMNERKDHATMCIRKLHVQFPALLDSMEGPAEKAYSAWPSKAYLVDKRGRVAFETGLNEQDFSPEQLDAALRKMRTSVKAPELQRRAQ